ncbi:BRO-N domain-containing protein [Shouchella shacheensis]|uniref:BRO-N domain-containing protein n=1 Tax=Shouchella shacheensis TaxID=1649580 RepID=UPI000740102F|nr:BRO family protein [Shouchella shacheensis]
MRAIEVSVNYEDMEIRVVRCGSDVWFVAKDLCDALQIIHVRSALRRLDLMQKAAYDYGGERVHIVNAAGAYKLLFRAEKALAEAFSDFLTATVTSFTVQGCEAEATKGASPSPAPRSVYGERLPMRPSPVSYKSMAACEMNVLLAQEGMVNAHDRAQVIACANFDEIQYTSVEAIALFDSDAEQETVYVIDWTPDGWAFFREQFEGLEE